MKFLILGDGWLGHRIANALPESFLSCARILDQGDAKHELARFHPEWVINCIGKTGRPNIDWCETHKQETIDANIVAPILLARACEQQGVGLVHLGSGCIYSGGPWTEDDAPNFDGSTYSQTKRIAEQIIKTFTGVLQLRVRMPIDSTPHERNLITKLAGYKKLIVGTKNSFTLIDTLIDAIKHGTALGLEGIYNIVENTPLTNDQIMDMYAEIVDPKYRYEPVVGKEFDALVCAARSFCILSNEKAKAAGFRFEPDTVKALRDTLAEYRDHRPA